MRHFRTRGLRIGSNLLYFVSRQLFKEMLFTSALACVASFSSGQETNSFSSRATLGRAQKEKFLKNVFFFALALFSRGRKNEFASRPLETLAAQATSALFVYTLIFWQFSVDKTKGSHNSY